MSREVQSLDVYLLERLTEWERENPRPDAPEDLHQSPKTPEKFMNLSSNQNGYISGIPISSNHVELKMGVVKNGKRISLTFNLNDLDGLIQELLEVQCDMLAQARWEAHEEAQALHRWKIQRGQRISEWKCEYQEQAEGASAS